MMGVKIRIQPSQAEKNRAAAAAKQVKTVTKPDGTVQSQGGTKVYITGITDELAMTESDLRDLFSPFGELEYVEIHREASTGKCKGSAFVQYKNPADAKVAIQKMNGIPLGSKTIRVQYAQHNSMMPQDTFGLDLDDESGNNFLHSAQSRAMLMQKLTREQPIFPSMMSGQAGFAGAPPQDQGLNRPPPSPSPTTVLLLCNMFNPREVDLDQDPGFYVDLKEEVEEECKKYGDVDKVIVDPSSDGNIWVKFRDLNGACKAQNILNNRFFNSVKIVAYHIPEALFTAKLRGQTMIDSYNPICQAGHSQFNVAPTEHSEVKVLRRPIFVNTYENVLCRQQSQIHSTSHVVICLLYTSPSPRDGLLSRMPSSA
eukprot:TRINITY_DN1278_c0_g1_i13.p1 TRINITY_DN1278_c0_g1~~TRINITY_DN1278_c0_g1_i13.p1  ORF type:complete len:370 (+),score=69.80 TRINITY_DN1278_c0_g1_i13:932-2041(+)